MDLYPEPLRKEIDELNDWVYTTVNSSCSLFSGIRIWRAHHLLSLDGVYKAGFATTQKAYEEAVVTLFDSLDRVEKILAGKDYLIGNQLTEADVRLFVSIVSPISSCSSDCHRLVIIFHLCFRYGLTLLTTARSSATFVRFVTATLPFICKLLLSDTCRVARASLIPFFSKVAAQALLEQHGVFGHVQSRSYQGGLLLPEDPQPPRRCACWPCSSHSPFVICFFLLRAVSFAG